MSIRTTKAEHKKIHTEEKEGKITKSTSAVVPTKSAVAGIASACILQNVLQNEIGKLVGRERAKTLKRAAATSREDFKWFEQLQQIEETLIEDEELPECF